MKIQSGIPVWAPKVSKPKIQRLYTSDANGIINEELIDEVGWALWSRCDSILTVIAAHYGRVVCPTCGAVIQRKEGKVFPFGDHATPWNEEDVIQCGSCTWNLPWKMYHQTYRGKQLFGGNAVMFFETYHKAFPQTSEPNVKMLLIDQLIHAFHLGLTETELGRPVGANLIEGALKEVIFFLDGLTNGPASAAGIEDSHDVWHRNLESISWARQILNNNEDE